MSYSYRQYITINTDIIGIITELEHFVKFEKFVRL